MGQACIFPWITCRFWNVLSSRKGLFMYVCAHQVSVSVSFNIINRQPVVFTAVIHSERCWVGLQMCILDWLILRQFVACCLKRLWLLLFHRLHFAVLFSSHVNGRAEWITLLEGFKEKQPWPFYHERACEALSCLVSKYKNHFSTLTYACNNFQIFVCLISYIQNAATLWFICMIQLLSFFPSCRLSTWHISSPSRQSLCSLCCVSLFVCLCVHVRAPSSTCNCCQSDRGHASLYTYLSHEY